MKFFSTSSSFSDGQVYIYTSSIYVSFLYPSTFSIKWIIITNIIVVFYCYNLHIITIKYPRSPLTVLQHRKLYLEYVLFITGADCSSSVIVGDCDWSYGSSTVTPQYSRFSNDNGSVTVITTHSCLLVAIIYLKQRYPINLSWNPFYCSITQLLHRVTVLTCWM